MSRRLPRRTRGWRPIGTAPKDEHILLLYQRHDHLPFVCQGRWVQWPHENAWRLKLRVDAGLEPDPDKHMLPCEDDYKGSWHIGYVSIMGSGKPEYYTGGAWLVFPTHWQPLPKPPTPLPRGYEYP